MANCWLHRISNEWNYSKPLLDKGIVTIGWSKLSDKPLLDMARDKDEKGADRIYKQTYGELSRGRWSLYRFACMNTGDTIVIPLYDGKFVIATIASVAQSADSLPIDGLTGINGNKLERDSNNPYTLLNTGDKAIVDIGFWLRVSNIKCISRSFALPVLQARMKMRQTNGCIDDLACEVDTARKATKPVDIRQALLSSTADTILPVLQKYITPDAMERLVLWYMQRAGATYAYIPGKNESGKADGADADVIADFEHLGLRFLIQVKKHTGETSDWAVKQIKKYHDQKAESYNGIVYIPWVISTGEFSEATHEVARQSGIRLIDGNTFARMIADAGIASMDDAFAVCTK